MTENSIGRRRFLRWGGKGVVATTFLGACRPKAIMQSDAAPSTGLPGTALSTPGEVASHPSTLPQLEAICQRTAKNIEGPFFRESAPFGTNVVPPGTALDKILHLRGQVFDASCKAMAGAILEFWQADSSGEYDHRGFHMRTRIRTDEAGRYSLDTIVPGRYLNGEVYRPAHIHAKVHALGHRSLTTQLYFAKDPFNAQDPWYLPELVIHQETTAAPGVHGRFDFYLGPVPG